MKNFCWQNIPNQSRIAVALSGGEDSVALLHALLASPPQKEITVSAVHVHHGIRGESADGDCAFVMDLCKKWGVPLRVFKVNVPDECKKTGEGTEACARRLRYECFRTAIEQGFCDCIVTAHHLSDVAETVLMRLLRGTGNHGLRAIRAVTMEGGLVRPMLDVKKQDVTEYVQKNGIPFVVDDSNADDAYTRNALRHKVSPALSEIVPEWETALRRYAEIATEDEAFLLQQAAALVDEDGGDVLVKGGHKVLAVRAFRLALQRLNGEKDVGKVHYDALYDLLCGQPGRQLCLPSGITAVAEYGVVRLTAEGVCDAEYGVPFALKRHDLPCGRVCIEIVQKRIEKTLCFDLDKLPEGAIIRNRRQGDRFRPFGGGERKLKEYLIDRKIPRARRGSYPVIAVGSTVYAVIGLEISQQLTIDEKTRRIAQITFFTEEEHNA